MTPFPMTRKNIKTILFCAAGVLAVLALIDGLGKYNRHLDMTLSEARSHWAITSALSGRADTINAQYNERRQQFAPLWQEHDPAKLMDQIDKAAKAAGVAVDNIRPAPSTAKNVLPFELNLRGAWVQLMSFFKIIEANQNLFDVTTVNIARKESTGELSASVVIQRKIVE